MARPNELDCPETFASTTSNSTNKKKSKGMKTRNTDIDVIIPRPQSKWIWSALMALALLAGVLGAIGCGGSDDSGHHGNHDGHRD